MNVHLIEPRIVLSSPRAHTMTVRPYGFDMVCEYEYDEGEEPIFWPTELAHPGAPSSCQLLSCRVGGEEIYDLLNNEQIERIEESILDAIER